MIKVQKSRFKSIESVWSPELALNSQNPRTNLVEFRFGMELAHSRIPKSILGTKS